MSLDLTDERLTLVQVMAYIISAVRLQANAGPDLCHSMVSPEAPFTNMD